MTEIDSLKNETTYSAEDEKINLNNTGDKDGYSALKINEETKEIDKIKPNTKKKFTFKERLKLIKDNTTVEPIAACYVMPSILASLTVQNLNFEKACRVNLNFGDEVCDALSSRQVGNYTQYEDEVQRLIAGIQTWNNVIMTAIPVLIISFVGAWSDRTGKLKACILVPIIGDLLSTIGFMINKYFFYELPVEYTALSESLFPAITGGMSVNTIGVFSYISAITTVENRTYRVGLVNMLMSLGYPIGSALSGVILSWVGYYGVFTISVSFYAFSLIYGYYYLEEPKRDTNKIEINQTPESKGFLRDFFDFTLVLETFKVAFKNGPGNRRLRVILLLCCVFVIFGPTNGEFTIFYLFTRYRFSWNEVQYSMWSTYAIVTNLIGTYFSIALFSNYLKLDDTLLGIISISSKIVASFAYAFARNDLEIYLAPLLEILNGTSFIAMRSIATKLVTGDDFGKVNSLFGLAEAMTPLLYGPLYTQVYDATLKILPGAVFLLGSILTLPAMAIFTWLYFEHKKDIIRNDASKSDSEMQQELPLK